MGEWRLVSTVLAVDRVTFELSSDGITYTALADPTRITGGWQLTGQSLPTQQNIFIRARGFFSTGNFNGSGSIIESVRNAFITLAPVITSPLSATTTVGQPFTYQITATNSPTTFNATGLPAGLTVDTATGLISGTPSVIGTSFINLSATNAGGTGPGVLTLDVTPPPPVITSPLSATATEGQPFSYQITATNSPASFDATGLPPKLTVNTATGLISGTPSVTGAFSVNLSATNAAGTGRAVLTLDIPPLITSPLTASATASLPFIYQFEATGATSLAVDATTLPPGLTFDPNLRAVVGSPTTDATVAETFPVTLSASNDGGTTTATLKLTVNPKPASGPVIISTTSATGRVGTPFDFKVITSGGTSAARLSVMNLPRGLSADPVSGEISGAPTSAGSFSVTLTVTEGAYRTPRRWN